MVPAISLILNDIRSSENVGSIFRTADAVGAEKIYLAGYTPSPVDRFGRPNAKLVKTALGAESSVAWVRAPDALELIASLKKEGIRIVALEQDARAVPYTAYTATGPIALILGNEVDGVSRALLDAADDIIEIPMRGTKESLNVAVAAGVALFALRGQ